MNAIYQKLVQLIETKQIGAYCTVVETKGSTPQKAGSKLLILPDLRNIGTLGGGCVEAEARQRAIDLIRSGEPQLLEFRLDSDYGWDDGLICGGNMKIFVDLPKHETELKIFDQLQILTDRKIPLIIATVVDSSEVEIGAKILIAQNGEQISQFESEKIENLITENFDEILENDHPKLIRTDDNKTAIFVEPIQPRPILLIAGAGHIGQALCHLGSWIGFDVVVVDDRVEFASADRLPESKKIIVGDIADELENFPIDHLTHVVIVTRGHNHDEAALHAVINSDAKYIGLIGSRRKIKLIFDDLIELGIQKERIKKVYAPIGIDINSKTVHEIAVSIASQLIQIRNGNQQNRFDSVPSRMPTVKI